jgi:FkbM family methyltransferase
MPRLAAATYHAVRAVGGLGLLGALKLFLSELVSWSFSIKPKGYRYPLRVRGRTSDSFLFWSIFCRKEYPVAHSTGACFVIDAGANAGYASVYLAHHMPNATVVAIEPEQSNFAVLVENTATYANVIPLQAALWSQPGTLRIANPHDEKWAIRCTEDESAGPGDGIRACTIPQLLSDYGRDTIDVLKIDIEGAEKALFSADTEWLSAVKTLMIEVHPGCWKEVFGALARHDYECFLSGENLVVTLRGASSLGHCGVCAPDGAIHEEEAT